MTFLSPWMLVLLAILPIVGRLTYRGRRLQQEAADLLRGGDSRPRSAHGLVPGKDRLMLAACGCLVVALARPAWNPRSEPLQSGDRDLVIALDVSRSMLAADVFPSRLEAARMAVFESLSGLRDRRIALITFAGSATVRAPLTLDQGFVRYMLERVEPMDENVGGTSLQAAIEKAVNTVFAGTEQERRDMIIFTDGEDHISNIEKSAGKLREGGVHALIVGLGDPVNGARIPDNGSEKSWVQYKGADVVSRLDSATLEKLARGNPDVTYFQAGTRPFDLMKLYQKLPAATSSRPLDGGREMVYTEGAPLFIAAALILLSLWRFPALLKLLPGPLLLAALLAGCGPRAPMGEAEFKAHTQQGQKLREAADAQVENDPLAQQTTLIQAREEFLLAAMFKAGDRGTAREISALTARIHALDEAIRKQKEEEEKQREELAAAVERLKELFTRQLHLAQNSQRLVRNRPPVPPEQRLAEVPAARDEQGVVKEGTASVLETVTFYQETTRKIVVQAFGKTAEPPSTEFDEAVSQLAAAIDAQRRSLENLGAAPPEWKAVNAGFRTAAERMKTALDSLSVRNSSPQGNNENDDEEMTDSDEAGNLSMTSRTGEFKTALENQTLPVPSYTAEEILAGEADNQKQRTRQKAAHAGAAVEKNW